MTQDLLTDLGEEYLIKNGFDAITVNVGLYNDATDGLSDSSDLGAITSEPSNGNYATASATFTAADLGGNWGVDNDTLIEFDFSDVAKGDAADQDVDTAYISFTFNASDTGDSSSQEHLLANPALSQTRGIGSIDTLEVAAGDLQIKLD